ncbi:hypothetical protein [Paenibacillus phytohabitans]|uniref:hypothetical protein n=1 Tax=Paenibacillus phytohabitans TaxID=2654978 RepID=UPI00300BDFF7
MIEFEDIDIEEIRELSIELRDIVNDIHNELTSNDIQSIDDNFVILDGPSDENSRLLVHKIKG